MSIISIKKGWSGMTAGGDGTNHTAKSVFTIVTSDPTDGPLFTWPQIDSVSGVNIPAGGAPYPSNTLLRSKTPQVSIICPTFFNVTVNYSTRTDESGEDRESETTDPLSEPAKLSWGSRASNEPVDFDMDGKPLVNAVGEPFDPPLQQEYNDEVLTITRNEAAFSREIIDQYKNTVAEGEFMGAERGTVRMGEIAADKVTGIPEYWTTRYEIIFRNEVAEGVPLEKAWFWRVLNQGFRYKDAAGKYHAIVDADGKPLSQPKLLAADGTLLATDADPVFLLFKKRKFKDWAPLGLDV